MRLMHDYHVKLLAGSLLVGFGAIAVADLAAATSMYHHTGLAAGTTAMVVGAVLGLLGGVRAKD
jgi:hypothetical protein